MSSSLVAGTAMMIAAKKKTDGRTITYTRPGATILPFTAWPTATENLSRENKDGASVVTGERDYLFAAADMIQAAGPGGSNPFPPRGGDRITDPTEIDPATGAAVVFEVVVNEVNAAWRWSDSATRQLVRVHTKRVKP